MAYLHATLTMLSMLSVIARKRVRRTCLRCSKDDFFQSS